MTMDYVPYRGMGIANDSENGAILHEMIGPIKGHNEFIGSLRPYRAH
jgi:hypothetical protein